MWTWHDRGFRSKGFLRLWGTTLASGKQAMYEPMWAGDGIVSETRHMRVGNDREF